MIEVWGSGSNYEEVMTSLEHEKMVTLVFDRKRSFLLTSALQSPYMQADTSFKFEFMSYGKTYTMEEKLSRMERFGHLPKGKVCTFVLLNFTDVITLHSCLCAGELVPSGAYVLDL